MLYVVMTCRQADAKGHFLFSPSSEVCYSGSQVIGEASDRLAGIVDVLLCSCFVATVLYLCVPEVRLHWRSIWRQRSDQVINRSRTAGEARTANLHECYA